MKINSYAKYAIRFLFLQIVITYITIYYFDKFLVSKAFCEYCAGNSFKMQIDNNLFRATVLDIFLNYEKNISNFSKYKVIIENEHAVFKTQVNSIFKEILYAK